MNTDTARRFEKVRRVRFALLAVVVAALLGAVIFFTWGMISPGAGKSSIGNIYTKWSPERVSNGDKVELSIDIEPGAGIDTVMTMVEFDQDRLRYQSTSYDRSDFPTQIPAMVTDNSVMVQAAIMGGEVRKEDSHVATIVFQAKSDQSPSAKISGGSAKAGEPLNPRINGRMILTDDDQGVLVWRWIYSGAIAVAVVVIGLMAIWYIKRRRKGRIQK